MVKWLNFCIIFTL